MIHIGLTDDQALVRSGFAMLINSQPDMQVDWQCCDGDEVPQQKPVDVVLMDIQMPKVSGIAATEALTNTDSHVRVIMLTTFSDQQFVHQSIDAGASGFLLKDAQPEELLNAIRIVFAGDAVLSPKITASMLRQIRTKDPIQNVSPHDLGALTTREQNILHLIALGLTNQEISATEHISMATVKTHVRHIFEKTHSRDRVQAVLYAFRTRLVSPADLLTHSIDNTSHPLG
ncbi:response regulator [Rothia terrae]|uniref:response regulator transcription factor n=1 Tax=Rothia terrae TaxID=396015 RepID=UPI0038036C48